MPKRAATVPATGIVLDRAGRLPMHRQLSQRLREAILAGQFPPGTRLPSTRTLASELGVSRTTALAAYEQLRDEGYLDGRVGTGTTVADLTGPLPAPPLPPPRAPVAPAVPLPPPRGIGGDHGEALGELQRDPMPHQVGLRDAVQQQDPGGGPSPPRRP